MDQNLSNSVRESLDRSRQIRDRVKTQQSPHSSVVSSMLRQTPRIAPALDYLKEEVMQQKTPTQNMTSSFKIASLQQEPLKDVTSAAIEEMTLETVLKLKEQFRQRTAVLSEQLSNEQQNTSALNAKIRELQSVIDCKESEVQSQAVKIEKQRQTNGRLLQANEKNLDEIQSLKQKLGELSCELEDLLYINEDLTGKVHQQTSEIQTQHKIQFEQKQEISDLNIQLDEITQIKNQQHEQIQLYSTGLEDARADNEYYTKVNSDLEVQIQQLKRQIYDIENDNNKLASENEVLRAIRRENVERSARQTEMIEKLSDSTVNSEQKCSKLEKVNQELQKYQPDLVQDLQVQVMNLTTAMEFAQIENRSLRQMLETANRSWK